MSEHTRGPWEWDRTQSGSNFTNLWSRSEQKSTLVASAEEYAGSAWMEICEADARLIAAAPEMLQALKDIRDSGCLWNANVATDNLVRLVIAKAEGGDA